VTVTVPKLRRIITPSRVSDEVFKSIVQQCSQLEEIVVSRSPVLTRVHIDSPTLRCLTFKGTPQLWSLQLHCPLLTSMNIQNLGGISDLVLDCALSKVDLSVNALARGAVGITVEYLRSVVSLDLSHTLVTDEDMAIVSSLPMLSRLTMSDAPLITNLTIHNDTLTEIEADNCASLQHIAITGINVQQVNLSSNSIVFAELLQMLQNCPKLSRLLCHECDFGDDAPVNTPDAILFMALEYFDCSNSRIHCSHLQALLSRCGANIVLVAKTISHAGLLVLETPHLLSVDISGSLRISELV